MDIKWNEEFKKWCAERDIRSSALLECAYLAAVENEKRKAHTDINRYAAAYNTISDIINSTDYAMAKYKSIVNVIERTKRELTV